MEQLSGKVAVVTGGGSGIGRAMALAFAAEGMSVAVVDVDPAAAEAVAGEVRAAGQKAMAAVCDVSDRAAVRGLADAVRAELGGAHIVCNNAGVVASRPTYEMTDGDWDWVLGVDLMGVVNGIQAFLPGMVAAGEGGHIVNTASIAGLVPAAAPNIISYTAAKYGVVGISETLHEELKPFDIGVSVLCPGVVRTRIGESGRNRPDRFADTPPPQAPAAPPAGSPPRIVGSGVIEPETLAQHVVRAVKGNDLYVVTHADTREAVEARFGAIIAAYDALERGS